MIHDIFYAMRSASSRMRAVNAIDLEAMPDRRAAFLDASAPLTMPYEFQKPRKHFYRIAAYGAAARTRLLI